jgi:putative Ca2+/H+ antiporter (TMEM165/GDT1 family)
MHIDERMVAAAGGLLFLVFGEHAAWSGVPE